MATDPVCRKGVDEKNPPGGKVHYWDNGFYFNQSKCGSRPKMDKLILLLA